MFHIAPMLVSIVTMLASLRRVWSLTGPPNHGMTMDNLPLPPAKCECDQSTDALLLLSFIPRGNWISAWISFVLLQLLWKILAMDPKWGRLGNRGRTGEKGRPNIILKILIILDCVPKRRSNATKAYSCLLRYFKMAIPTCRRQAVILP